MTSLILENLRRMAKGPKHQKEEKYCADLQHIKGEYFKDYRLVLQKNFKNNN